VLWVASVTAPRALAAAANALEPCRTESAHLRHAAKAERCRECWPSTNGLPPMPELTKAPGERHWWKGED
jgi:hypothetical protein